MNALERIVSLSHQVDEYCGKLVLSLESGKNKSPNLYGLILRGLGRRHTRADMVFELRCRVVVEKDDSNVRWKSYEFKASTLRMVHKDNIVYVRVPTKLHDYIIEFQIRVKFLNQCMAYFRDTWMDFSCIHRVKVFSTLCMSFQIDELVEYQRPVTDHTHNNNNSSDNDGSLDQKHKHDQLQRRGGCVVGMILKLPSPETHGLYHVGKLQFGARASRPRPRSRSRYHRNVNNNKHVHVQKVATVMHVGVGRFQPVLCEDFWLRARLDIFVLGPLGLGTNTNTNRSERNSINGINMYRSENESENANENTNANTRESESENKNDSDYWFAVYSQLIDCCDDAHEQWLTKVERIEINTRINMNRYWIPEAILRMLLAPIDPGDIGDSGLQTHCWYGLDEDDEYDHGMAKIKCFDARCKYFMYTSGDSSMMTTARASTFERLLRRIQTQNQQQRKKRKRKRKRKSKKNRINSLALACYICRAVTEIKCVFRCERGHAICWNCVYELRQKRQQLSDCLITLLTDGRSGHDDNDGCTLDFDCVQILIEYVIGTIIC